MERIEEMVFSIIGKTSKKQLAEELGMTFNTLMSRIVKGGWLKSEIEVIERLYKNG